MYFMLYLGMSEGVIVVTQDFKRTGKGAMERTEWRVLVESAVSGCTQFCDRRVGETLTETVGDKGQQ